jgi:putative acetyltransferase
MPYNTNSEFLLRPIVPDDNRAVAQVIRTVMTEFGAVGPGYSIQDPEVDNMFDAYSLPRAVFFVLEKSGKVLGCGGVAPLTGADAGICELRKMYFHPEARGHGFGQKIMELLQEEARGRGFSYMYLETISAMTQANGLYRKMGFIPLPGPMGNTGHTGCGLFYGKEL